MFLTLKVSIAILLTSTLLGMKTAVSFQPQALMPATSQFRGFPSTASSPIINMKPTPLHATAYDEDENIQDEGLSLNESEETTAKKEMIVQVMVVAVGAFFAYSLISVVLDTTSYMSNSMSQALNPGNVASFTVSAVGAVATATWEGLKVAVPFVGHGVMEAGKAAAPIVQEASQKITEAATPMVQEAAQKVSEVATPIVQEAAQRVSEATSPMVEQATQAVNEATSPYVSAVDSTISSATDMVTSTLDSKVLAPIKDATDSMASAVDSSIKDAAGSVGSSIQGAAAGAVASMKDVIPF